MIEFRRLIHLSLFLIGIGAIAASNGGAAAQESVSDARDTTQKLASLLDIYQERLAAQDVDGILELYSSDPVFMPEYAPAAVGRNAVRTAYEQVFATLKLKGRFIVHEVEAAGDTAWVRTSSTGRFAVIASGVEGEIANNELFVFKREKGTWRMHRYIFAASAPPPAR